MSTTVTKKRWPWAEAMKVAGELVGRLVLAEATHRLEVVGSLRRHKDTVGDIELLYIPRWREEQDPREMLPHNISVNLADRCIAVMLSQGLIEKRTNILGREMYGERNKLMRHVASGIAVDLFAATEENWFNYLVCRTGGAENNIAIAQAARAKGWQWNPYGTGFSRERNAPHVVTSEEDVFRFVGLPYREPRDRS